MLMQQNIVNLLSKLPGEVKEQKKTSYSSTNNYPEFKSFLDKSTFKAMSSSGNTISHAGADKAKYSQYSSFEAGKQIKAFRDIPKNVGRQEESSVIEEKPLSGNELKETNPNGDKNDSQNSKSDTKVKVLAQVLGVNTVQLSELLQSLGIEIQELSDTAKIDSVTDKLSSFLGLNENEIKALKITLTEVSMQVDSLFDELKASQTVFGASQDMLDSANGEDWVKLSGIDMEIINTDKKAAQIESFIGKLKESIKSMTNEMEASVQPAIEMVVRQIKVLTNQQDAPLYNEAAGQSTESTGGLRPMPASDNKGSSSKKDENPDLGKGKEGQRQDLNADSGEVTVNKSSFSMIQEKQTASIKEAVIQNADAGQFAGITQSQDKGQTRLYEISRVAREVQVPKNEIISQVVEKAKVVISGDKSEMLMDLKPESLGKLSLKIVTERGMVVAKFIAESYQVKETLESNMQLLKDTLEKQGLSVQGFSVSVGGDSSRGFGRNSNFGGESRQLNQNSRNISVDTINTAESIETMSSTNPYMVNESSINFIA